MAVTARFIADFSSFHDAVRKAEVGLKEFESGAGDVRKSLERMTDQFSGRKLIQEALLMDKAIQNIGGVSVLTAKELQNAGAKASEAIEIMKRGGREVPPGLQKIADASKPIAEHMTLADRATGLFKSTFGQMLSAFTAASLIQKGVSMLSAWTVEAVKGAGAIVDLSSKTGLSMDMIQRFSFVAAQTGSSMEAFTGAAFKLGVNLSGGSTSVRAAVDRLGLSFADLMKLNPDQQFDKIARALESMEDPQARNETAVKLFGKTASEILPAIAQGYSKLADSAKVSSDAQLLALDAAADRWDKFVSDQTTNIRSLLGDMVMLNTQRRGLTLEETRAMIQFEKDGGSAREFKIRLYEADLAAVKAAQKHVAAIGTQTAAIIPFTEELAKARVEMGKVDASTRAQISAAQALGKTTDDITDRFGVSAVAQRLLSEAMRAGTDVTKKAREETKKASEELQKFQERFVHLGANDPAPQIHQLGLEFNALGKALKPEPLLLYANGFDMVSARARVVAKDIERVALEFEAARKRAAAFADFMATPIQMPSGAIGSGLEDFNDAIEEAGKQSVTFASIFGGVGNILDQVGGKFAEVGRIAANTGEAIFKSLAAGDTSGAMIAGTVGLISAYQKLWGPTTADNVAKLRKEFIALSGGTEALRDRAERAGFSLTRMMNTQGIKTFQGEVEKLNKLLDFQNGALDQLADDEEKYHLSLDKTSASLYASYKRMTAGNRDANLVVTRMKDDFNKLVSEARKWGIALPESMRPILQRMVDLGQLVDENGEKLTDLSSITFDAAGDSGTSAFDRMTGSVDKLVAAIKLFMDVELTALEKQLLGIVDGIEGARRRLPGNEPTGPSIPRPAPDTYAVASGGLVMDDHIQRFAGGGNVLPFFPRPSGTDTVPAMLTPGELVLNANQQKAVGALMTRGGGGATTTVNINITAFDGPSVDQWLRNGGDRQITAAVARQLPGVLTRLGVIKAS